MTMKWNGDAALRQIHDTTARRIEAGLILIQNEAKTVLSVAAPRTRVKSAKGVMYYRATTPATKGAPPRKLSGRLRASVGREMDRQGLKGRVGTNVIYGRVHEFRDHKWLSVAIKNLGSRLEQVLGSDVSVGEVSS
jgi:phage gpG-like protein